MIYELSEQPIYSYTRKQAIEDGVLADLSVNDAVRQHWRYSLAASSTVWSAIEKAIRDDDNDLAGIIHDISVLAKLPIRSGAGSNDTVHFTVNIGKETCNLKLHLGPGDDHEPVLTLMFANED